MSSVFSIDQLEYDNSFVVFTMQFSPVFAVLLSQAIAATHIRLTKIALNLF